MYTLSHRVFLVEFCIFKEPRNTGEVPKIGKEVQKEVFEDGRTLGWLSCHLPDQDRQNGPPGSRDAEKQLMILKSRAYESISSLHTHH